MNHLIGVVDFDTVLWCMVISCCFGLYSLALPVDGSNWLTIILGRTSTFCELASSLWLDPVSRGGLQFWLDLSWDQQVIAKLTGLFYTSVISSADKGHKQLRLPCWWSCICWWSCTINHALAPSIDFQTQCGDLNGMQSSVCLWIGGWGLRGLPCGCSVCCPITSTISSVGRSSSNALSNSSVDLDTLEVGDAVEVSVFSESVSPAAELYASHTRNLTDDDCIESAIQRSNNIDNVTNQSLLLLGISAGRHWRG